MSSINLHGHTISFQPFDIEYLEKLVAYFNLLSPKSKSRFGPHPFTNEGILEVFPDSNYRLFIAVEKESKSVVAYTIVKTGWIDGDVSRFQSYNLSLTDEYCTIAPSVADDWQSQGLGSHFFHYVTDQLRKVQNRHKIVLWGGVQATNKKALEFYKKHNFKVIGEFEHHGANFDMIK